MFELLKVEKIIIFSKNLRVRIIRASELIEDIRHILKTPHCVPVIVCRGLNWCSFFILWLFGDANLAHGLVEIVMEERLVFEIKLTEECRVLGDY